MSQASRRTFLVRSTAAVATSLVLSTSRVQATPPSERVRIGVIGGGNQGKAHVASLLTLRDAEIVYVCDVDEQRLAERVEKSGGAKGVADLRRILDDHSIDAVTIATPDHWHTPVACLALAAGKHVYVEKPCSHNVREGRILVDAVARHQRVLQHGTQSRSCAGFQQAIQLLREGLIGEVLIAKCWNWQRREDIGHGTPTDPPAGVDYGTWVGPAEWVPYQANRFHYNWHWWYNFGCGDMGNDGVHELDYALWGLGVDTHPTTISALGGKYFFEDDQQFPDTQQVTFEFPGTNELSTRMLIYEQRLWSTTCPFNVDSGAEFYGTKGMMFLSKRGKFEVRGERNRLLDIKLDRETTASVAANLRNWIDCIKSAKEPNAPVGIAHRVATVIHLGNISTRLRRTLQFDPDNELILTDAEANGMLRRIYRAEGHWSVPVGI